MICTLVITDTWLCNEVNDEVVSRPSYTVFQKTESRGGGVAILIKEHIEAALQDAVLEIERLCVKLSCWGKKSILYDLYRSAGSGPD